jgi:hypothetical protein
MRWNYYFDDTELGNLDPEAFNPLDVDGPFDPQNHWLQTASKEDQLIAIRAWFLARYCDPIEETPYIGSERGFQFINGGPHDPTDVLFNRFSNFAHDDAIQEVVDEMHAKVGDEWAPVLYQPPPYYDDDYGVTVKDIGDPLRRLVDRLKQSRQVLTLEGDSSAKALVRNLAFSSTITALESFLWETVVYWVDHDEAVFANIVTKIPVFRDQTIKLGDIFEKRKTLVADVKGYLQKLVWHRLEHVAPLLKLGLGVNIPSLKQFENPLIKRHDIIHRSGFTKDGELVVVNVGEIDILCDQISSFAVALNRELTLRNKITSS